MCGPAKDYPVHGCPDIAVDPASRPPLENSHIHHFAMSEKGRLHTFGDRYLLEDRRRNLIFAGGAQKPRLMSVDSSPAGNPCCWKRRQGL